MKTQEDSVKTKKSDEDPVVLEAITELEKSFGLGVARKSRIISRGFSLNEIVKDSK